MMDWPDAEEHFTSGLKRLTRIDAGEPRHLRMTDEPRVRLPVDLRNAGRVVGLEGAGNQTASRVLAEGRVPRGG
jgi:hypothetical protein